MSAANRLAVKKNSDPGWRSDLRKWQRNRLLSDLTPHLPGEQMISPCLAARGDGGLDSLFHQHALLAETLPAALFRSSAPPTRTPFFRSW